MITFTSVASLERALRAAEAAHQVAEVEGKSTPAHWPQFYAHHMANTYVETCHGLQDVVGASSPPGCDPR